MISMHTILVAVDFSKESILAARFAVSLAQEYKARLYVLHVMEAPNPSIRAYVETFDEFRHQMQDSAMEDLIQLIPKAAKENIQVEEILEIGHPHQVIVEKAEELDVDTLVVGTHGRTGLSHVLVGSVAERVVRHAPCPVFVVRNPKDKYIYGWE
jgi:nucleotide-binding universal stress UspA family protein